MAANPCSMPSRPAIRGERSGWVSGGDYLWRLVVIGSGQTSRQADPAGNGIKLRDYHAVGGRNDVRSNDAGDEISKAIHSAIRDERLRFALVEIGGDPCGLNPRVLS